MMAQLGQVLATYWRQAISGPIAIVAMGLLAFSAIATIAAGFGSMMQTHMAICTAFLGSVLVGMHFKQQIIQIRQRRLPNAVLAHVIVVVGILILLVIVLPAISMAISKWSWGVSGLCLAISAVTFAYFTTVTPVVMLLFFALLFMALVPTVQTWLVDICQGRHEVLGLLLLVVGLSGIVTTLARLLQLSDEGPGSFDLLDPKTFSGLRSSPDVAQMRTTSFCWSLGTSSERQVQLWPQWARGSRWDRIRLWSAGSHNAYLHWVSAVFYLLIFFAMYIEMPRQPTLTMIFNALFMTFSPVFTVTSGMSQRRQMTGVELLRPAGRSQFFTEMGLAYAYRVPMTWLLFSIAWCVPAYLYASDTPVWKHQVFNLLVLTAGFQVLAFGLTVWAMRYVISLMTWTMISCGVYIGMIMGVTALSPVIDWHKESLDWLLWITPIIVAAGALLIWGAHRRWMQTELG